MRTKILLVILVVSSFIQVAAQEKKFNFGIKVAPAISWLSSENKNISSDGAAVKCNWGFIGAYNFSQNFSLVSGFNFNYLEGKLKTDDVGLYNHNHPLMYDVNMPDNNGTKRSYTEFQIPAVFQMKSNEIEHFKIFLQIGLAGGVLVKAKQNDVENVFSETSLFNSSFIVAAGVDFPIKGDISLIGQLKYNGGLTNVGKGGFSEAKVSFVELGLGILF